MEILEKVVLSDTQIATLENGGIVVVPASWDEFWEFLKDTPYKAEFSNNKIIIMGLAAAIHEFIIGYLITHFNMHYNYNGFTVYASNIGVKTGGNKGYFNPDITLVKGKLAFFDNSNAIITNPYIVVEVLSEATYQYDMHEKLGKYQHTESIQEVIMIDRFDKEVLKFQRTPNPKIWTETIYDHENPNILIDTVTIDWNDLFDKLTIFEA